jgi:hypothetical protein
MAKNKYALIFALVKHIQQFDSEYTSADAVSTFTKGRTTSLRDLKDEELPQLAKMMQSVAAKPDVKQFKDDPRDQQRKAIIAIFKSNGKTTDDAKQWCESNGVFGAKKGFNEYNGQDLFQLARVAEKMFGKK